MVVLAIDQGTSATKALVLEGTDVLAAGHAPVEVRTGPNGAVEVDPYALWESVLVAGRDAITAAGSPHLDAIGLANQGETIVAWDAATGQAIGPAIVWQDDRASVVCDELASSGPRLAEITGLTLDPYFVAPKVTWLRRRVGPRPRITTSDAWLLHQLCGTFVTDAATASRTLLLDLDAVDWSSEACDVFSIDPAALPAIVDNATVVGESRVFGDRAVPVSGLCVDQQAALFAQGCFESGDAKCTYGTGAFLLATTSRPIRSGAGLAACVAWRLGGQATWCLDGQVFTVGAAISWLQRVGLIDDPSDLDRLGASVGDSGGVQFVPALAGLGAPFWTSTARASFTGLSLATERAHLVRAVVDGIAANVAWLGRAVGDDLGHPIARLRVDGGVTRSATLLQAQADLLQVPVEVFASPDATAIGAGALAALGCGLAASPRDAVGGRRPATVYEPSISPSEAGERLGAWRRAADAAADRAADAADAADAASPDALARVTDAGS